MANEFPAQSRILGLNAIGTPISAESLIVRIVVIASLTAESIRIVFLDHLVIRECIRGGVGSSARVCFFFFADERGRVHFLAEDLAIRG